MLVVFLAFLSVSAFPGLQGALPQMTVVGFEYLPEDPPRPYECGAQHYVKSRQPYLNIDRLIDVSLH